MYTMYGYLLINKIQLTKPKSRVPVYNNLTWLEPAIQSQTSTWTAVNFKNTWNLDEF